MQFPLKKLFKSQKLELINEHQTIRDALDIMVKKIIVSSQLLMTKAT